MNKQLRKILGSAAALAPIPILWCVLLVSGTFKPAQQWAMNQLFRLRGEIPAPVKVVYVDIDAISMDPTKGKGIGGMPWSRHYFANVAHAVIEYGGAKAVGIDVLFSTLGVSELTDRRRMVEGNREFYHLLQPDPPVVIASAYTASKFRDSNGNLAERHFPLLEGPLASSAEWEYPELPEFDVGLDGPYTPPGTGFIDDPFGGRQVALWAPSNVRTYYSFSIEILRRYWGLSTWEDEGVRVTGDTLEFFRDDGSVVQQVPLTGRQLLEVNWFSPWESEAMNPRFPFADVYWSAQRVESGDPEIEAIGRKFFDSGAFRDAIVLIGPVDEILQDLAPTPFDDSPVPKVGLHGNVIKTIASGRFLRRLAPWQVFGLVGLLTVFVVSLAVSGGRHILLARVMALLALVAYAGLAVELFAHFDLVLPLVTPIGSALSTTLVGVGWQAWREQKAKSRIKGMFGTYLSPAVVETMIESGKDPELGGHDAEITAYFSDIQSFSSFSEVLSSSQLGELLNEYLTVCTDIIQAEGGTLDKFIGDAVVAMFGAPVDLDEHAYKACLVSQLVQVRLGELRAKWKAEGDKWPPLVSEMRTRIGLNTGVCMIGNMGGRSRFNYTMMGDNVNLAARMESGAKSWGAFTMVTQATRDACERHGGDRLVFRPLGRIVVKGRSQPVPIHEIVGVRERLDARTAECLELFAQGMERFYARDWNRAAELFMRSEELEPLRPKRDPGVKSNPSLVYQRIVAEMADHPPAGDWDGVYHMTEK